LYDFIEVSAFVVSPAGGGTGGSNLFAGTDDGIWRRPLSEMITSAEETRANMPALFCLEQNYPNPLNAATVIKYTVGGVRG